MASWLLEAKVGVLTIYGGVHPTIAPDESIAMAGIDMICRSEGEAAMVELTEARPSFIGWLRPESIPEP